MKDFLKFLLIWISQNLAIPFWMIGHIHLSMNMSVYQDLHVILASLGMNIIVAIGFWIDYKSQS
jgi:cytosine/uracil/thiamine/allantoin permease